MRISMRIPRVFLQIALCLAIVHAASARASADAAQPVVTTVERARNILDQGLTARNPDTRKEAVRSLGLIGPHEPYLGRLLVMLKDKDVEVRVAAIASLQDLQDKDTLSALRIALKDPVLEVGFAAVKALWAMNDPVGRDAMLAVLDGERKASSGYFTKEGRSALRMFYTPKAALPYLMGRGIGFAHVAGLGLGVASLEGLLSDPNISGRATAALLLSTDHDPNVLLALRQALADKDESVRAAVVYVMALRNDTALEAELVPFLDDKAEAVQLRAAAGCLRLELLRQSVPAPLPKKRPKRRHP